MYNNFNFISSEVIVAEVKQELKSYFDSGLLTEVLMPTYIDNALRRLRVMVLDFKEEILPVENYRAKLPKDFSYLKDAFLCNTIMDVTNPTMSTTFEYFRRDICNDSCDTVNETFEKTTMTIPAWITTHLQPTLLRVYYGSRAFCSDDCNGLKSDGADVVRINKSTVTTSFEVGNLYIQYFARPEDEYGPLIPELVEVEEFIKAALYYNLFELLYNSVTDESINIIERKLGYYKQKYFSKYESALNTLKEETKQETRDNITKQGRRYMKFMIN